MSAGDLDASEILSDAGPMDAETFDAGITDAAPPDAGVPDAAPPDTGPPDTGVQDAGTVDTGMPDAGPMEAGFAIPNGFTGRGADTFWGIRMTLPQGVLLGFGLRMTGTVNATLALYTDNAGVPGTLVTNAEIRGAALAQNADFAELSMFTRPTIAAGDYWVFGVFDALVNAGFDSTASTGLCFWRDTTNSTTRYSSSLGGMPGDLSSIQNCFMDVPITFYVLVQ